MSTFVEQKTKPEDRAAFVAFFPPIQSAIKRGGDGMRITLDIPETEVGNALKLLKWTGPGHVLRITVELMPK